MQTMKHIAPVEVIREEYRKLTLPQMLDLIKAIGIYFDKKIINQEVHDHLLFQLLLVVDEKKAA